jgi:putative component of toxin-antitoxin plasmid stabilization module
MWIHILIEYSPGVRIYYKMSSSLSTVHIRCLGPSSTQQANVKANVLTITSKKLEMEYDVTYKMQK